MPVKAVCRHLNHKAGMSERGQRQPTPSSAVREAMLDVDARGLEPPQPLVVILEAVSGLSQGAELRAHTDRRPMHLYGQLMERGFIGISEEQPDGSFITTIRRA
jgi:TusA-related sulfurtransferase